VSLLPPDFSFSQGSLQDYVDCPRRFYLRYVRGLEWPAPVAEPMAELERAVAAGEAFHRLVHQHILGLPVERLTHMADGAGSDVGAWWAAYLADGPLLRYGGRAYPESSLTAATAGYRLIAKYDLILAWPGHSVTILDWKTGRPSPSAALLARLQTRVYRHVLVAAGAHLNGGRQWRPEQVTMVYWYANRQSAAVELEYDVERYESDRRYLSGLIARIAGGTADADFAPCGDERGCRYCRYRSLCARSVCAAEWSDMQDTGDEGEQGVPDFDFEQIAEIAY
jgi:RecB family exonuclease